MENPDPLTYIFKLRPNAKHHDLPPVNGRNVDSEDCKASWEAYVANPRAGNKGVFLDFVDHYETPNPSTFIVKLKKPNTWLIGPHGFAGPNPGVIGPKELFDGGIKTTTTCIGPGGFVLEQFDSTKVISFKRRPDPWYPNDGRPYPDRLVWTVITDPAVRAAALKAKQIDRLAARDKLEAEEFKSYGPDMRIRREPGFPSALIVRADSPTGLFADVRVREAIYNALDIQELIDSVALGEGEYSGPVPPFLKAWAIPDEEVRKAYPHDVNKAKQILSSAGWDNTKEVELKYPTYPETSLIAELVQKQLGLAGIRIRLVPQDPLTVWQVQTLTGRDFQMTIAPGSIVYIVDPDFRLRQHTTIGGGGGNYAHWSDPEVDDIVARQATEFDFEKQKKMIQDAQRLVLKKFSPFISLHQPYSYTAYWSYYHPYWTGDDGFVGLLTCRLWTEKP
jgi:peptide/nickel transport system substrate-binding protein